jgi:hypothetical protein
MGWTIKGSQFESQSGQELAVIHVVQTSSVAHPPGAASSWVKLPGREADHSPTTAAEVKKTWIYTSSPPYIFMV